MRRAIILLAMIGSWAGAEVVRPAVDSFTKTIETQMEAEIGGFVKDNPKEAAFLEDIRQRELATRTELDGSRTSSPKQMASALSKWNEMVDKTIEMKLEMMSEYATESDRVKVTMDERIAAALSTADNLSRIVETLEEVDGSDDRRLAQRGTSKAAMRDGRAHVPPTARAATTAGGADLIDAYLTGSYTWFDDDAAGGDGSEWELAVGSNWDLTDAFSIGVGVNRSEFEIGGVTDVSRETLGGDLHLLYEFSDSLAFAVFGGYARVEVDDVTVVDPLLGPISLGDEYDSWNGGLALSYNRPVGDFDVGITPALVSLDADSPGGLFDSGRTAALIMVDCQRAWTDQLSTIVFASHFQALADDLSGDRSYWFTGAELSWAVNDQVVIGLGYEKTLGYEDYSDHRLLGNLTWNF